MSIELPPLIQHECSDRRHILRMVVDTPCGRAEGLFIVPEPMRDLEFRVATSDLLRAMRRFIWKQGFQYVI